MKNKVLKMVISTLLCCAFLCFSSCKFKNYEPIEKSSDTEPKNIESESFESEEPTVSLDDRPHQILAEMTIDEKIGQMFLVRCYPDKVVEDIKNYKLGGLVLFASDFDKTADEVVSDIEQYKAAAKYGLIIAVDEEGGTVVRVSKYKQFRSSPFLSPAELYKRGGFELVRSDAAEKAELLLSLGINVNLAPVCDVPSSSKSFIYERAFSTDPRMTAKFVKTVVEQNQTEGIGSVLKHFPGYGDNGDTHIGYSYDNRDMSVFEQRDFLPFLAGINAGAEAVMVSHNTITCMDPENPASLSKAVHDVLRDELNFSGVIMTDDLSMDAIKDYGSIDKVGIYAVLAGNDIICTSDYEPLINSIKEAVNDGTINID